MRFTDTEIEQILFGHFINKTHLKERRKVYLKRLVKNVRHFFPRKIEMPEKGNKPVILLFSNELFFDLKELHSLEIYAYKDKLSQGKRLNFDHEEILLVVSTFLPFLRQRIFDYVYRRISDALRPLKPVAFVCNYPQLIDHVIARYCSEHSAPVMTIQHGVYMPRFYHPLPFEKDKADFIFVWSQLYADCYERGGIEKQRLKICSPPIKPPVGILTSSTVKGKPVFLGQALYKINDEVFEQYNRVLADLIDFWEQRKTKVSYKPHPRELLSKSLTPENLARLRVLDSSYVHDDFFDDFDVAYSINSTSLVHALCAGLLCFQFDLGIPELPTEDFSQWSSMINLKGVDDLHDEKLNDPPPYRLDEYFLNLTQDFQKYNSALLLNLLRHE